MFLNFDTGKNIYKCKLSTQALCDIEDILGCNPVNILVTDSNELPKLKSLLVILYHSMKDFNHGIKFADIYDIFDEYCANEGDFSTLLEFIMNLFEESQLIKSKGDSTTDTTEGQDSKN